MACEQFVWSNKVCCGIQFLSVVVLITYVNSTRPFLSIVEKRWIAFQLLNGLRDARNRKIFHGDIKSENILVTSWNWIYLTDFASYKSTYTADLFFLFWHVWSYMLPYTWTVPHPSHKYGNKCQKSKIAMEGIEGKREGKITEALGCFSAGCVIAELLLEGAPLFTLSQLFKCFSVQLMRGSRISSSRWSVLRAWEANIRHFTTHFTWDCLSWVLLFFLAQLRFLRQRIVERCFGRQFSSTDYSANSYCAINVG